MNLRFAPNSIRIRTTAAEFKQLCENRTLSLDVPLPHGHAFRAKVNTAATGDWQFDSDPTGMWLSLPRQELDNLAQELPSRIGIIHRFGTQQGELQISFEVDTKSN
jgi:hypothetical protein